MKARNGANKQVVSRTSTDGPRDPAPYMEQFVGLGGAVQTRPSVTHQP
jgi:hypothetical protein